MNLAPHNLQVALLQPEIAPNTGNIGRLCVATGTRLHLVRPLGFVLSDQKLKRSGMDYWDRLNLTVHDDDEAFFNSIQNVNPWLFSSKAQRTIWDADFTDNDILIFGSETKGISQRVKDRFPTRQLLIPQTVGERCLNLSTAVGIGLYEALRQLCAPTNAMSR